MGQILVNNIAIEVIKKDIKNLRLTVLPPNGKVRVSAPKKMADETIRLFIVSKLSWINKHKQKYENREIQTGKEFISGEVHYFLGRRCLLNVIYIGKGRQEVEIRNKTFIDMKVREGATREQREGMMKEWYRTQLKQLIPALIYKWEPIIGVKVKDWGVKLMKTRWGTCNTTARRIWVNLDLAQKSPACLEYIVVHEMVHLLERHHNDRFKEYMDRFLPNWSSIKDELNGMEFE